MHTFFVQRHATARKRNARKLMLSGGASEARHSSATYHPRNAAVSCHAGDKGNNFYLIKSGTCDVWVADASGERMNVRTLSAGSWCGELSLVVGKPRSASIMATSEAVTWTAALQTHTLP